MGRHLIMAAGLACVAVVVVAVVGGWATVAQAQPDDSERLSFETAYGVCESRFLDGSIAEVWFASSLNQLNEDNYRGQLEAGEIDEDEYLDEMRSSYEAEFNLYEFWSETVVPFGESPNCQALVDRDESPPDSSTPTTSTTITSGPVTTTTVPGGSDDSGDETEEEEPAPDEDCNVQNGRCNSDDGDEDNDDQDDGADEDEEEEVGPVPGTDYVMGTEESCDKGSYSPHFNKDGEPEAYQAYGAEWFRAGQGSSAQEAYDNGACIPIGWVLVGCRDENSHAIDDHGVVLVKADLPRWWFEEAEIESTTGEGNGCAVLEHRPSRRCDELVTVRTVNVTATVSYTVRDTEEYDDPGIVPDKCWGTYPSALYDISANDDNNFDVLGMLTALMFGIAKGAIQAVLWLVEFGFTFNITEYTHAVGEIADKYQDHLIEPLLMLRIVWFALVAWMAITALRGKLAMAGGELLMTLILLTMATVLYENNAAYMRSTANFMDLSSSAFLSAAQGEDPSNHANVLSILIPLEGQIHEQFIEHPYQYLQWGNVVPDGPCGDALEHVMAVGHDANGWPSRHMRRAGDGEECDKYANYNKDASGERTFGALLTMVVAVLVALTLGITAFTVLVCKFLAAVLFAVTPFVVLSAVLPATGRRLFWSWLGSLFQLVLAVIGSGGLLAFEFLGVETVTTVTENKNLIEQWVLVLMVVATVFLARRKMIGQAQTWATSLSDNLTRLSPGSAQWSGGGQVGFDLDRLDRGSMQALRTAGYGAAVGAYVGGRIAAAPVRGASRGVSNWMRDKRNKRFGARNLAHNREAIQEWEQRPTEIFSADPQTGKIGSRVEARLRLPSDRREVPGYNERVNFIRRGGRPGESEAVLPGNNVNRHVGTYDSRRNLRYDKSPLQGGKPAPPRRRRRPSGSPRLGQPPNLKKLLNSSRNRFGRFKMRWGGLK